MDKPPIKQVSSWLTGLSLLALVVLAIADLLLAESVPLVVYGIVGGIALGADGDTIPAIFGVRRDK